MKIKMKYKFKDVMKTKRGAIHKDTMSKYLYQYFSNIFLWVFLNTGISANGVGFIMAAISIAAAALFLTGVKTNLIMGSVLFIIAMVLDHTDGDVARITKTFSKKGIFWDHVHHSCEEIFTFTGLGIYLAKITSNYNFFLIGILVTVLMWVPNYFRATMFWFLKVEGYYDMKYRKLPFVLLYGDFFKAWHFLVLLSLLFNVAHLLLYLALIWVIVRFLPKMYIYYRECGLYDKKHKK